MNMAYQIENKCILCGGTLQHQRSDSKFCCLACKQIAYRVRQKQKGKIEQ